MRGFSLVAGWNASMQNLVVHVLAMRQLGRLNPRHLLAAGYGQRQTEWCPRTIHIRQLWGCSNISALGGPRSALRGRDAIKTWSVQQLRFKSKKKGSYKGKQEEDEEDEEDEVDSEEDSEDEVDSEEDSEDEVDSEDSEDPNIPKGFKDIEISLPSLRSDVVLKSGLGLSRKKVEDAFYDNKLRVNGVKLLKKSRMSREGDYLDLEVSFDNETRKLILMRVIFRKILWMSEDPKQYRVILRRWKNLQLLKKEFRKS